jgi:hypothetical protein
MEAKVILAFLYCLLYLEDQQKKLKRSNQVHLVIRDVVLRNHSFLFP